MSRNLSGSAEGARMAPALLVTDNAVLRYALRSGFLHGLVGPPHVAVHLSRGTPSESDLWNAYVRPGA